jgi:hypothetical protein
MNYRNLEDSLYKSKKYKEEQRMSKALSSTAAISCSLSHDQRLLIA